MKKVSYPLSMISGLGIGFIPPVFLLPFNFTIYEFTFSRKSIITFLICIILGLSIYSFNGSFETFYNLFLVGVIILFKSKIINNDLKYSLSPVLIYFIVSFIIGLAKPQLTGEARFHFYGSEINFTAFNILLLSIILFERQSILYGYIILFLSFALTLSRTAFFSAIFIIILRIFKNSEKGRKLFFILFLLFAASLFFYLYQYDKLLFKSGGYAMGVGRLFILEDASSMGRIYLNKVYGDLLVSNLKYALFGLPDNVLKSFMNYNELTYVAHNSYLFKALSIGIPSTLAVIISGFLILPKSVMYVLLLYSLALHSLLSPALFLFLSFYIKKSE